MSPELKNVIAFCLAHAPSAPVQHRVLLYRGLAEICGDPQNAANFRSLANDLERAESNCRQFAFDFQNRP